MKARVRVREFGRVAVAILFLITLETGLAFSQGSTATMSGVARDASGALIPGVSIAVKNTESGQTRSVVSSESGGYTVQFLPVGPYEVTTNMPGFKQQVRFLMNGVDYIGSNSTGQFITPSGSSGQLLGVDAVREYNVLQHTYGAEYGKRAGAQVTVVSSSGTNQWHGDAFEYLRNSALDARNFFDDTIAAPPFKRNQFGGALGGPLKNDKAFIFANYEGFRERLAVSSVAIVPDAQARLGFMPCYIVNTAANACPGRSAYVPVTNLKTGMLPYANYFWPSPNGPELLSDGLPTGTAKAISNPRRRVREDFGLLRFDSPISAKDSFYVNFNFDDGDRATPPADPVFITLTAQRSALFGLQETHVFSPTVLNIATLGYSRAWGTQVQAPAVPIPQNLVFLTGTNPGSITIGGGSNTNIAAGLVQPTGNSPNRDTRNHFTAGDDVRVSRGTHSWSMGGWAQYIQQNMYGGAQATAGTANYPTLLAFLQDAPSQFIANANPQPVFTGSKTKESLCIPSWIADA